MTLTSPSPHFTLGKPASRNKKTPAVLKRYLDLTLTGTKKNLATHCGPSKTHGRKEHPPSPYTFDNPERELSIRRYMTGSSMSGTKTPVWFDQVNGQIKNHDGEAIVFSENYLPANKHEQVAKKKQRPLSGISTKSAPVVYNGDTYYRPKGRHNYLQASKRPMTAKVDRETRASKLRNKHRVQTMSATPSNDTKLQLKRMKEQKPKPIHMNKDLVPIPSHIDETPHSFIVGARYNCSNFMDSRSFSRLGLYVPRQNPLKSFLKNYKYEAPHDVNTDFAGSTGVKAGNSGTTVNQHSHQPYSQTPVNQVFIKKVAIKEAWLSGDNVEQPAAAKRAPSSTNQSDTRMTCNTPISRGGSSRRSSQSSNNMGQLMVDSAVRPKKSTLIEAVVPRQHM